MDLLQVADDWGIQTRTNNPATRFQGVAGKSDASAWDRLDSSRNFQVPGQNENFCSFNFA
jgi:hypothetical protein